MSCIHYLHCDCPNGPICHNMTFGIHVEPESFTSLVWNRILTESCDKYAFIVILMNLGRLLIFMWKTDYNFLELGHMLFCKSYFSLSCKLVITWTSPFVICEDIQMDLVLEIFISMIPSTQFRLIPDTKMFLIMTWKDFLLWKVDWGFLEFRAHTTPTNEVIFFLYVNFSHHDRDISNLLSVQEFKRSLSLTCKS